MNIEKQYEFYKSDKKSKEELKESIIEYAYIQVDKDRFIEAGDFILRFMAKVDDIIDNYNSNLASFMHYINQHIKWLMLGFNKEYKKQKEKKEAFHNHYTAEFKNTFCCMEEKSEYIISNDAIKILSIANGKITKESSRKRLEIFTLKISRFLTTEHIETLAPLLRRTTDWIYNAQESLNEMCKSRIDNRDYLTLRHNRLFIEITRDQKKLTYINDGNEKDVLFYKMKEKQKRKNALYEKLKSRNCGPKNEEIAQYLGIPKGTVDSSLFYIKKSLKTLLPGLLID